MTELSIRTESTELPGGRLLRVSAVERPKGDGRTIVVERLPGSAGARSLMEPANGDRLTLDADELPMLVEMLEAVEGEQ